MKRLWGIRHVRYFILKARFVMWWSVVAQHYWMTPNESDIEYLRAVWRGEA